MIVNLADRRAAASRGRQLDMLGTLGPDGVAREFVRLEGLETPAPVPNPQAMLPHLVMPDHHDVRPDNMVDRCLQDALAAATDRRPVDFADLLLVPGVGARTVRALAGTPCRFSDPARFVLTHGGKDRHPFPVPTRVYDHSIQIMKSAVRKAKLGHEEELAAIRRLDQQARGLEATASGPSFSAGINNERARSHDYSGSSVFGWEPPTKHPARALMRDDDAQSPHVSRIDGLRFEESDEAPPDAVR